MTQCTMNFHDTQNTFPIFFSKIDSDCLTREFLLLINNVLNLKEISEETAGCNVFNVPVNNT